ncbi:MAG: hypothetical protein MJ179_02635 [Treponema sp.]|nr:hypothetical protein [Treponema sp.]
MADEFGINATINADTKGFESGIDKAQKKTKSFSKSITDTINKLGKNGLTKSLADISLAVSGLTKAYGTVSKAIKKVNDTIKETIDLYNQQLKAETLLEVSAKNNPYLTTQSVNRLKQFASEMQNVSTIGDEQMLPTMSRLASAGRNEAEIQKIIKTALDLSASGMMDFDSAVNQLNGTLNGSVGALGKQIAGLKNLSEEDLKSGKAIDIVAKKFEGLAESTTKATGSYQQMINAQGDFKEALGKITKPTSDLWNRFWKGWYEQGSLYLNRLNAQLETTVSRRELENLAFSEETEEQAIQKMMDMVKSLSTQQIQSMVVFYQSKKKLSVWQREIYGDLQAELLTREIIQEKEEQRVKTEMQLAELAEREAEAKKEIAENILPTALTYEQQYNASLNARKEYEQANKKVVIEANEEIEEEEKGHYKVILKNIADFGSIAITKIKKIISTIRTVISAGYKAFIKLANINIDEMLDNLLIFEDNILKFFINVVPQLPKFISGVLSSVAKMFKSIVIYLKKIDLAKIITEMLSAVSENAGDLVNNFIEFLSELVTNGIKGLADWIAEGGLKKLLKAMLDLQKGIENIVTENIDELVNLIIEALPDIMETLKESIVSASKAFGELVGPLMKIVMEVILQLIEVLTSQEVIDASIVAIGELMEAMVRDGRFAEIIIKVVEGIVRIITNVPKLFEGIINGIFNGLLEKDWKEFGKKIAEGFKDILLTLFGKDTTGNGKNDSADAGKIIKGILTGGLSTLLGFATGSNNVPRGLALVGEHGPELVDFKGGERVYNAQNTASILNGANKGNSFNVTFNNLQDTSASTMIRQLKAYNRQMAINGIF